MCLNATYSNVWISKYLSDTFPIKNGLKHVGALLLLIFNFAIEYAIIWVQADVNLLGESIQAMKKNTEVLLVASKETSLEKCWGN